MYTENNDDNSYLTKVQSKVVLHVKMQKTTKYSLLAALKSVRLKMY